MEFFLFVVGRTLDVPATRSGAKSGQKLLEKILPETAKPLKVSGWKVFYYYFSSLSDPLSFEYA